MPRIISLGACSLLMATTVAAQNLENADYSVERLVPAIDREGIITVESGTVAKHLDWDAALWLNYALNPLTLYRERSDGELERIGALVGHRVGANAVGSIALLDRLRLGFDLPVVLFQARGGGVPGGTAQVGALPAIGVGDLRLIPKVQLLNADWAFVDLAFLLPVTVPTGFPQNSYMGEGQFTFAPQLALSRELGMFRVAGNLGYKWRPDTSILQLEVGHELGYRLGGAMRLEELLQLPLEVGLTLNGATSASAPFAAVNQNPLELIGGVTWDVDGPLQLFGGAGAGLVAGYGTPDLRLFGGVRYSPRAADKDADGIDDAKDGCVDDPEDKDRFEDSDGCPDTDNDADGIDDARDKCPDQAEDRDRFEDANGCPDPDNDGDGVLDGDDTCPLVAGLAELKGCPATDADGDGVVDDSDKCPQQAEDKDTFEDTDGCPDPDNDQDGIADRDDQCLFDAEDQDGFEDGDGCPDPDNDRDGIVDSTDRCPNQAETVNNVADEDGCPDQGESKVVMTRDKIVILDKVYFKTNSDVIEQRSHDLLTQVAAILKAHPEVNKVRVEGHTDNRGSALYNKGLSQRRAESVCVFLSQQGIAQEVLEAVGYGLDKPVADNATAAGREKNRRVEFTIVEINGKPVSGDAAAR